MQPPEEHIIKGLRDGQEGTYREVFNLYFENLSRYAFTILRDMDDAEDVVQAVFMKIWEKKEELTITYTLKSYLYKAVHNLCLNKLEHREIRLKFQETEKAEVSRDVQQPEVFPHELENSIRQVIENLPPQCRTIFTMSRYQEMKYAEIAATLGISVNTIENQISKALKILRENLKDATGNTREST